MWDLERVAFVVYEAIDKLEEVVVVVVVVDVVVSWLKIAVVVSRLKIAVVVAFVEKCGLQKVVIVAGIAQNTTRKEMIVCHA